VSRVLVLHSQIDQNKQTKKEDQSALRKSRLGTFYLSRAKLAFQVHFEGSSLIRRVVFTSNNTKKLCSMGNMR